jgi:acetyltransferase-like isoleucine patch superfamily enzyme
MFKGIITNYIRKTKNKDFQFDEKISSSVLLSFLSTKSWALLKGFKFFNFKHRGKLIFLGRNVRFFNRKNMRLGNNLSIGDYVTLSALGKAPLHIGDNVNIGAFSQVIISTSLNNIGEFIRIGDNVGMGEFAYIGGGGGTTIGANTIIGQYFSTHPENHNFNNPDLLIREQGVSRKGIFIGCNCWIGSKVTILDGVHVGDNCVIAAGSVVTKCFANNSLIGGVPAKLLKSI